MILTKILFTDQWYLFYLISVMVVVGLIKEHNLFACVYSFAATRIKNQRSLLAIIAAISGVLPVPGRVLISAGILDTATEGPGKSKCGILGYLATHHYYFWSPLEKTVIIPMAVLGLTYTQFMSHTLIPLLISLAVLFGYLYIKVRPQDVHFLTTKFVPANGYIKDLFFHVLPFIGAIAWIILGGSPWAVFTYLALYYIGLTREERNWYKLIGFVNWQLVGLLAFIIVVANVIKLHSNEITYWAQTAGNTFSMTTVEGFMAVSLGAFLAAFAMGSSAKFSGIVALLTTIYGLQYLTYFFVLEFCAYLLSPTHKCVAISAGYFKTPLTDYYKVIGLWALILMVYAVLTLP